MRGKRLLIERRAGSGRGRVVRAVTTGAGGPYAARVTLGRTEHLRVVFAGVAVSRMRLVDLCDTGGHGYVTRRRLVQTKPIAHRRIFGTR